ncbi:FHA domain-containing protein [Luteolibacter pohnpeiensis]|uniref:FHA domain-containing protein n=1 Tax=Luteolibacter pohnpeiensis TaxID=454153 RepID=A0A934VRL1_9BACT|nr:FHA domain-containing protein [Luteolibacter pohnpeiensis]MBK1883326.1 FHA domain-containing protein [Luteolibacter pohnpeiensis]
MPRVTITVPDSNAQPYRFQLDRQVVSLGRGSDNDIVIDSSSVSTVHAEMRRVVGGYQLVDLGSTNGLKLGEERVSVITLLPGVCAKLGDVAFDFSLSDDEQAALLREQPLQNSPILKEAEVPRVARVSPQGGRQIIIQNESEGNMGFFAALLVLVLVAFAFLLGIQVRHKKETGVSLMKAVQEKYFTEKVEVPAKP